jgi:hypothetical protein
VALDNHCIPPERPEAKTTEAPTRAMEFRVINICIHIDKAIYSASMKKGYIPNIPKDTLTLQQDSIFLAQKKARKEKAKETHRGTEKQIFFFFFFLF